MFAYSRTIVRRRVVVNLITGRSFNGILWAQRGPLLVLRDAALITPDEPIPVDGEVVIERSQVEFVQALP